jgi:hypothetical protein
MLNIVDIGQSVTSEAINQSSLGDIPPAAAMTAKPARAGKDAPLDAASRGFSPAGEYAVIDVDAHKGGGATFQRMILIEGFPKTAVTQPKRGHGRLFCALPPGVVVQSGGIALGPGLTLQTSRGSSICARSYAWATDDPVAAAPQWLLARIDAASQSPQHMTDATAPTAHAAATAPCINSHQTEDNMRAHDASNSEERAQAAAKSADILPFTAKSAAPKLAAALDHAKRGFSVFPLCPWVDPGAQATDEQKKAAIDEAKKPAIKNWPNLATTDARQIEEWWQSAPDNNIGIYTGTLLAVDIDPRHGGHKSLEILELSEEFPSTAHASTQGGGVHIIYRLPEHTYVNNSVGRIAPGIDVRSYGGYIVGAGSTMEGRSYAWLSDNPVAVCPQWLIDRSKAAKPKGENAGKRVAEETEAGVELARKWIYKHAPEASEGTRNNTAYQVANKVIDYGLEKPTCVEVMQYWNFHRCFPSLDDGELTDAVNNAYRNRKNTIGCASPDAPGMTAVVIDERKAPPPKPGAPLNVEQPPEPSEPSGCMATPLRRFDPAALPPVPWVVPGLAARRNVSTLTGPGGMSKSMWGLMLAVAVVTGRSDICGYQIPRREIAWVYGQEDDIEQMELRLAAIMQAFNVSWGDLCDDDGKPMLYLDSGRGKGKHLNLAKRVGETVKAGEHLARVIASAKEVGAKFVSLDPLVSLHQSNENDNAQMRAVFDQVSALAVEADCAVLITSHTGKPDKASSKGFTGDPYAGRGASAQHDAARVVTTFMGMAEGDVKAWGVPAGASHLDYVRIDDAKSNLGKKRREPRWFKREEVVVRGFTGDSMEVLRPVELEPNAATGRPGLLEAIAKVIADNLLSATPHTTAAVAAHLTAGMAAAIKGKNKARTINEAFGGEGVDEYMTNSGTLRRSKGTGNKGTMFTLLPADASLLTPQMLL